MCCFHHSLTSIRSCFQRVFSSANLKGIEWYVNQGFDRHVEVKEVGEPGAIDGVQKVAGGDLGLIGARRVR